MIPSLYKEYQRWCEKGRILLLSDTHINDPDREAMGFEISSEDHVRIIKRDVTKYDTMVHLGDVGDPEWLLDVKGYKVLIMGNHDQSRKKFEKYFDEVYSGPLFIGEKILLSHEPIYGLDFCYNFHGHNHSKSSFGDENHLNLAPNVTGYRPVNLGRLIKNGILANVHGIHRETIDEATRRAIYKYKN